MYINVIDFIVNFKRLIHLLHIKSQISVSHIVLFDMSRFKMHFYFFLTYLACVRSSLPDCNIGWEDATNKNLGHLWFETFRRLRFDAAQSFCENMNSSLIEIESQEQMDFVVNKLSTITEIVDWTENLKVWWGGATDKDQEGTWRWLQSGETFDKNSFVWGPDQPDNTGGNEDYFCFWRHHGFVVNIFGSIILSRNLNCQL